MPIDERDYMQVPEPHEDLEPIPDADLLWRPWGYKLRWRRRREPSLNDNRIRGWEIVFWICVFLFVIGKYF